MEPYFNFYYRHLVAGMVVFVTSLLIYVITEVLK